jgi:hypothetical protein
MSGFRINFHKSEVMVLGCSTEEQQRVGNMLSYNQGNFPFVCLGLLVSDSALSVGDWNPFTLKVSKRANP